MLPMDKPYGLYSENLEENSFNDDGIVIPFGSPLTPISRTNSKHYRNNVVNSEASRIMDSIIMHNNKSDKTAQAIATNHY